MSHSSSLKPAPLAASPPGRFAILPLLLTFCLPSRSQAVDAVWIGPATGNWNTAAAWQPQVPNATLDAYVDLSGSQNSTVTANVTASVKNLFIGAGDELILGATSFTVAGNVIDNAGIIRSRQAGVTAARDFFVSGETTLQGPGKFILTGNGHNYIKPGTVAPGVLTVAAGHEITTTPDTVASFQNTAIYAGVVNHGTITADGGGLTLYSTAKTNHSVFRAINGGFLDIESDISNTDGTLIAGPDSILHLESTLTGGMVTGPGTLLINTAAGLTGPLTLDSGLTTAHDAAVLTLAGTITNNGLINFGADAGTLATYLYINGAATLEGTGKVRFQNAGRHQVLRANNAAADILTVGAGQEITTDAGTAPSYQSSAIHAGVVNYGTITADGGGLTLYSVLKTNHGTFRAINGGFLDIESDVSNTDGTLIAGPDSTLHLESTLTGGTVTGPGTLLINTDAGLTGPLLLDRGLTTALDAAATVLTGTITNNGVLTFGSASSANTAYMVINGPVSLEGSGKVIIQNAGRRQILRNTNAATDILTVGAQQEITTDARTGLNYQSSALHAAMVNYGTITADGGGLTIYNLPKTNHGTMRAINGGYMDFVSVTVTNYNATTDTLTGGRWEVVSNGTATTMDFSGSPVATLAAGTTVRLSGAAASIPQLSSLTNISGTLVLENGKTLATTGNMTIPGTLQFGLPDGAAFSYNNTRLAITGNVNFAGTRVDIIDQGLTSGSYLLAAWTGTLTGAPVPGSFPPGSQHSLVLDSVTKTLRLEIVMPPPIRFTGFTLTPGTGPDAGQTVVSLTATGQPDASYAVMSSLDMMVWTPAAPPLSSPAGELSWQIVESGSGRRFYRIDRQ